jgi:hypothetical protein
MLSLTWSTHIVAASTAAGSARNLLLPPYRIITQITWRTETKACFDWLQIRNKTRPFNFFNALIKEGTRTKLFHTAYKTVLDCMRGERLVEKLVWRENERMGVILGVNMHAVD